MRLVIGAGAALAALALGCAGGAAEPKRAAPPPREIEVLELAASEVRDTGEYLGSLLSRQRVEVLPQVGGQIRRIHVRPGQRVEAGAPLLEIDGRQESAALDSAAAQQRSAAATLALARQTRTRAEALYQEGLASAQELERANAEAEAAEAALKASEAQVAQRQVLLQYFVVRAPFAATVGEVRVRVGDQVGPSTLLTTLSQADVLEIGLSVPAERARALRVGAPLEVLDDAGEVMLTTEVFYIAPEVNPRTRLVEVKGVFRNAFGLRPAELVRARLVYGSRQALKIPALAVVRQSGQAFAYAVEPEPGSERGGLRVRRRPIVLGPLGQADYVLEAGLEAGDRIAVSSIQTLRDGAPVVARPLAATAANARPAAGAAAN